MNKKAEKALASTAIMGLVVTTALSVTNFNAKASQVNRVGGQTRIETANDVAKTSFKEADTVILVNGWGYADAVSATPLSKKLNAPILLTQNKGALEGKVKDAIENLGAKKVVIVGGTGVVSNKIKNELSKKYTVERVAGSVDKTRMGTNVAVAKKVLEGSNVKEAILVNGQDGYADALSVASIAAVKGCPVLFASSRNVANVIKDFVKEKGLKVLAVGGSGVLPDKVVNSLNGKKIASGSDRFDTNLKVLNYFKNSISFDNMYVAAGGSTSTQFADALVASAAAAKSGAPVVLTGVGANYSQKSKAEKFIKENKKDKSNITIVGGEGSVDKNIEENIKKEEKKLDLSKIDSVKATTTSVDYKESGILTLKFEVNGFKCNINQLDKAGYDVEFQATEDVFEDEENTSNTGELLKGEEGDKGYRDGSGLAGLYTYDSSEHDDFSYKVIIKKNGTIVEESEEVNVDVISAEDTADELKDYTLRLYEDVDENEFDDEDEQPVITSNKLIEGEKVLVTDVKANTKDGKKNATLNEFTLETSNGFVATVGEEEIDGDDYKVIKAVAAGDVTITIRSGNIRKEIKLHVLKKNDDNKRKVSRAKAQHSSLRIAQNGSATIEATLLDQYGDPIVEGRENDDFTIKETIKDNDNNKEIADADVEYKDNLNGTDEKGRFKIKVTSRGSKSGKGDLEIYKKNGIRICTIPIEISSQILYDHVDLETKDSASKDLTLDINPEAADKDDNDKVELKLNAYTKRGVLIGAADGSLDSLEVSGHNFEVKLRPDNNNYTDDDDDDDLFDIEVEDGDVIKVTFNRTEENLKRINTGSATVVVKEDGVMKAYKEIKIVDSSPRIKKVNFITGVETSDYDLPFESILRLDDDYKVLNNGIELDGSAGDGKVYINDEGVIYINTDVDDGQDDDGFDEYDVYLGRLSCAYGSGSIEVPLDEDDRVSNHEFNFDRENGKDLNGTISIGVIRLHDTTPFQTVNVKVKEK